MFSNDTVDASGTATVDQTTTFTTDAVSAEASILAPFQLADSTISSSTQWNSQDVKSFLAKPVVVKNGVMAVTDNLEVGTKVQFPEVIRSSPVFMDKLKGYRGFKADLVFRIVFNANKFQQGRYFLAWMPLGGGSRGEKLTEWSNSHMYGLSTRTQLPHVEFDLSCDSEATLRIPWSSGINYAFTSSTDVDASGAMGDLHLFVYSPLVAPTGSTTASYTVYAHLEKVELFGAIIPQSGRLSGITSSTKKKSATIAEAQSQGVGPISGPAKLVGQAAGILTGIPVLSSFMYPLSWVADIVSETAKVFGFSKPINMGAPQRVTRNMMTYWSNYDTVDQSLPLSLDVENAVQLLPGLSGTDIDEMAFGNICTIPAFVQGDTWTTSMVEGHLLSAFGLDPMKGTDSFSMGAPGDAFLMTPLGFVARHFDLWRGSIRVTIKFVKTEYHSGRLAFAFVPYDPKEPTAFSNTYADQHYLQRHVVDIRDQNELTLEFPFFCSSNYLKRGDKYGEIIVSVVDPLVAPSSVSSTITILYEVAGGADMEFAYPTNYAATPVTGVVPQSGSLDPCMIGVTTIGGTASHAVSLAPAATCVGERITSFRQLVKQMNFLNHYGATPNGTDWRILPFAYSSFFFSSTPADQKIPNIIGDLYGQLSTIFLYSRGGVRLKFIPEFNPTADVADAPTLIHSGQYFGTELNTTEVIETGSITPSPPIGYGGLKTRPLVFSNIADEMGSEVLVPQYHNSFARLNIDGVAITPNGAGSPVNMEYNTSAKWNNSRTYVGYSRPVTPGINTTRVFIARAGADDVQFSGFVSIPPYFEVSGFETF